MPASLDGDLGRRPVVVQPRQRREVLCGGQAQRPAACLLDLRCERSCGVENTGTDSKRHREDSTRHMLVQIVHVLLAIT
jgi:hypothetical protein